MTWRELTKYIEQQSSNDDFLDSEIKIYDFSDGEEYEASVTELLFGNDDEETGWVPYLTINQGDENDNQSETQEASVD